MKKQLGALAIAALLASCSGQDNEAGSDVLQAHNQSSDTQAAGADSKGLATLSRDKRRTLGGAPDKGELFAYADKAGVKRRGAYTLLPVQLSEEHAIRGVVTGLMTLPAPDGKEIRIRYDRHEESADGNWSWIGKVIGGDVAQEAIFTFGEKAVFGSIPQATGPALRLTTEGGIAYLMQADPARLKRAHRAGGDTKVRARSPDDLNTSDNALVAMAQAQAGTLAKSDVAPPDFTSANTIDLVLGYSNGFVASHDNTSVALTRLSHLITSANQALLNSHVNARIRVVASVAVNYADNTDNGDTLEKLTGSDGSGSVPIPTALTSLRAAREQYGADLVTLVRDFRPENNGCGIAWLNGAHGAPITTAADAPYGYSVVSDGQYDQDTSTYFCEDITLVHEMAHNMGSVHDVANADGVPGRYPYSYGLKTSAAAGNFYTVMAYGDDNQTLYRVFSNPQMTTSCGGRACGVANQADNARSLRQTIPLVARFRGTVVPIEGQGQWNPAGAGDIDGNGRDDLVFTSDSQLRFGYWKMNGTTIVQQAPTVATGAGDRLVAKGDFNGDNRLDLVWLTPTRELWMWFGNGTSLPASYQRLSNTTLPFGWDIEGTGDVDGDGRDDLLLVSPTQNRFTYWRMNGATVVASMPAATINAGNRLVASGDFNGDNKLDLVWATTTRQLWMWLGNGTTLPASYKHISTPASEWGVVGAGDVNGDGKDDLIFTSSQNRFTYWIMNGTTIVRTQAPRPTNAGDRLVAIGDFNGDNRLDLVWLTSSRKLWMWLGNGTSLPASYTQIATLP